jgi:hypothetical protein
MRYKFDTPCEISMHRVYSVVLIVIFLNTSKRTLQMTLEYLPVHNTILSSSQFRSDEKIEFFNFKSLLWPSARTAIDTRMAITKTFILPPITANDFLGRTTSHPRRRHSS